jgi:predicted RNA-binding Zn ribbon-like protein
MPESDEADEAGATPPPLGLVEDFVNTRSVEFGSDDLATADGLRAWLDARGLLVSGADVTSSERSRAVRLREGLRALIAASQGALPAPALASADGVDPAALDDLAGLARALPLVLDVSSRPPRLTSDSPGTVDAALATLLGAVAEAVADGTWARFKVCREPGCRWAYYDHSRNRSRAWCSMETCGNRAKARAFRKRAGG